MHQPEVLAAQLVQMLALLGVFFNTSYIRDFYIKKYGIFLVFLSLGVIDRAWKTLYQLLRFSGE